MIDEKAKSMNSPSLLHINLVRREMNVPIDTQTICMSIKAPMQWLERLEDNANLFFLVLLVLLQIF